MFYKGTTAYIISVLTFLTQSTFIVTPTKENIVLLFLPLVPFTESKCSSQILIWPKNPFKNVYIFSGRKEGNVLFNYAH